MNPTRILDGIAVLLAVSILTLSGSALAAPQRSPEWKREVLRPAIEPYLGPVERAFEVPIGEVPVAARAELEEMKYYWDLHAASEGYPSPFQGYYAVTETVGGEVVAWAGWAYGPEDVGHYEGGVVIYYDADGQFMYELWRSPSGTQDRWE